ncbi:LapA family protein [Sphingomonas sp.]|uniref:LapA family protein n=1 Tax=Sphingomonas sp. TaxID=28214 RepID=UPI001ED4C4F6|nr:LapA family protein [Sphingomonas sp.]MBX3595140.1 LapA family protein [Sphingomonas sp.]
MQFLKALFWFLILGLAAAFAVTNWQPVEIRLWSGLVADVNLPFLLLVMFLIGFVPVLLVFHTWRWRMKSRVAMLERTIEDLRPAPTPPPPPVADPEPVAEPQPSAAPSLPL